MSNVGQKDIARKANLSVATVSRTLAGSILVPEATRQRVLQISHELGYVNYRLLSIQERQFKRVTLAIVYGDECWSLPTTPLAEGALRQSLRLEIRRVTMKDDPSIIASLVKIASDCDALLLTGYISHTVLENLCREGIRHVVLGHPLGGVRDLPAGSVVVTSNMADMGRAATQRLIALGHRRIGFIGSRHPVGMWEDSMLVGYHLAHMEAKFPVDPKLVHFTSELLLDQAGANPAEWFTRLPDVPTAFVVSQTAIFRVFAQSSAQYGITLTPRSVSLGLSHSFLSGELMVEWPGVVEDVDALIEASFEQVRQVLNTAPFSARLVLVPYRYHLFEPAIVNPKREERYQP